MFPLLRSSLALAILPTTFRTHVAFLAPARFQILSSFFTLGNIQSQQSLDHKLSDQSSLPHRQFSILHSQQDDSKEDDLPYKYRWPRPSVTTDIVIFAVEEAIPYVLLIKRGNPPFQGSWALPGGFLDLGEGLEACAARELQEETGVVGLPLAQVGAFGDPGRDPRGPTVTVAFMALAPSRAIGAKAADDAVDEEWFPLTNLPSLAFDHLKILEEAWQRCKPEPMTTPGAEAGADPALSTALIDRATGKPLGSVPGGEDTAAALAMVKVTASFEGKGGSGSSSGP